MIDVYQIYETKLIGADCILIIISALSDMQAQEMVDIATEIGLAMLAINLGSAYVILCLDFGVAQQFGYYHLVISLSMLYLMYRRFTGEGISWK